MPLDEIAREISTKWADPETTLNDIQRSVNINKLLNKVPASGQSIVPIFVNWLNALGSSLSLQSNVTANSAYLKKVLDNIQDSNEKNGGMKLSDDSIVPAYEVAQGVAQIQNGLKGSSAVKVKMTVKRTTESELQIGIVGGADFSIPVLDFLTLNVGGNLSYFQNDIATTSNETTVEMDYTGVTLVQFGPVDFSQSSMKNWFWMAPIREAIANGTKDVSGFKFAPKPKVDFSVKGPFGYVTGAAISNFPNITITVKSSNYEQIRAKFEQSASVGINFLGIPMRIGSQESSYSNTVNTDASASTVTITLSPPKQLIAGNVTDSEGWILGVLTEYPAAR